MIKLGFSTTNKILSRLVRWFTKSKVSHCFVIFEWLGEEWVLESEWAGIQIVPMSSFMARQNIIVETIELPDVTMEDLKPALKDAGVPYDYSGLFGSIFPIIGHWFKMRWSNPWNNSKAMFCSEFIVKWFQEMGFEPANNLVPEDTTPDQLLKVLMEHLEK